MDCVAVERELVAYTFATLDAEAAAAVDEHLVGCTSCLRAYLSLRRDLQFAPEARPSAAARARLRAEVLATFGPRPSLRQRLGPRALVASVALVGLGLAAFLLEHDGRRARPGIAVHVDSARPTPISGSIY